MRKLPRTMYGPSQYGVIVASSSTALMDRCTLARQRDTKGGPHGGAEGQRTGGREQDRRFRRTPRGTARARQARRGEVPPHRARDRSWGVMGGGHERGSDRRRARSRGSAREAARRRPRRR